MKLVRAHVASAALRHKGQMNGIRFDKFRYSGCEVTRHADDFPFSFRHSPAHVHLTQRIVGIHIDNTYSQRQRDFAVVSLIAMDECIAFLG